MVYRHFICEVIDMDEVLQEIEKQNLEITAMLYLSDSQQILCVCKEGKKGFIQQMKEKQNQKLEMEEGE